MQHRLQFLQALTGYADEQFMSDHSKQLMGIDISKLNVLHWIIYFSRQDLLNWVINQFYPPMSDDDIEEPLHLHLQGLQDCVRGQQDSFYDIEYFKQSRIKKNIDTYSSQIVINLENMGQSQYIKDKLIEKMHVQLKNVGLVIII